jgi:hypothetical protein
MMKESGGRQFSAETEDVTRVSRAIAYSLKNYYALSFVTESDKAKDKSRSIRVRVPKQPQLLINARRSYIPVE